MANLFTSKFYINNRKSLKSRLKVDYPIVLAGNGLLQRGGDGSYPFHQDSSFWYFTGCDEPDLVLVLDEDEEYLIIPIREGSRAAFDGEINELQLKSSSGIELILNQAEGWKRLKSRLAKNKQISTMVAPPDYIKQIGIYSNPARANLINRLKKDCPGLKLTDITKDIASLRVIKQPVEIAAMQKAIDITVNSLSRALQPAKLANYFYEYEIEAELNYDFRRLGADGHAFTPIIASGENACVLHNIANNGKLKKNQLILCDVGAEYEHYAADITRTICLGKPNSRQQSVYDAVLETQDFALSLLRPGVLLKEYELKVEQFVGTKMRSLGLFNQASHKNIRHYMPHAVSHFLGLNAHDIGLYDQPLKAGMVVTVEPGIYIKDEAIGVRIEDDVLITKTGDKVLSKALPRNL